MNLPSPAMERPLNIEIPIPQKISGNDFKCLLFCFVLFCYKLSFNIPRSDSWKTLWTFFGKDLTLLPIFAGFRIKYHNVADLNFMWILIP